jgi:ketosteroid isomerase-like protein
MKKQIYNILLALALTNLMAINAYASDTADDINKVNRHFETAFANGDAASLANVVYNQNGQLLPTTVDIITGRPNIQAFWQSVFDMGVTKANLDTVELDELGDTAIEVGKYVLSGSEDQTIDHGKYIVIWKKVDNQWHYHRDIWNSSVAPTAH